MKKFQFLAMSVITSFIIADCIAQTAPADVQKSFKEKFAQAKSVKWSQEDPKEWEAEFKLNGTEMSASYDETGSWLETESAVKQSDLPAEVQSALKQKYDGWKIEEAESIEKPEFKGYEIALEKGEEGMEIVFSADGNIISESIISEEEEGEEKGDDRN